jgi:hypothetical protein
MTDFQALLFGSVITLSLMLNLVQLRYLHRIRRRIQRRLP